MNNEDIKNKAEKIFGGIARITNEPAKPFDLKEQEAKDRSKIAILIIKTFLCGIVLILIGTPIYNWLVPSERIDIFNFLTTYSGVLGPFVGVIAGYYFKN